MEGQEVVGLYIVLGASGPLLKVCRESSHTAWIHIQGMHAPDREDIQEDVEGVLDLGGLVGNVVVCVCVCVCGLPVILLM